MIGGYGFDGFEGFVGRSGDEHVEHSVVEFVNISVEFFVVTSVEGVVE